MKKNWTLMVLTLLLVSFTLVYFGCSAGSGTGTATGTNVTRVSQTSPNAGQPDNLVPTGFDYFLGTWQGLYTISGNITPSTNSDWPWKNLVTVIPGGYTLVYPSGQHATDFVATMTIIKTSDNNYASSLSLDGNIFVQGPFNSDKNTYGTIVANTNAPSNNPYGFVYTVFFKQAFDTYSNRGIFYDNRVVPNIAGTANTNFTLGTGNTVLCNSAVMSPTPNTTALIYGIDSNKNAITDQTKVDFIYMTVNFSTMEKVGE